PAVSVARLLVSKLRQFLFQLVVLLSFRLVAVARSGNVCQLAGLALSCRECFHEKHRVSSPFYELSPFFIKRAFNISRSRLSSAWAALLCADAFPHPCASASDLLPVFRPR